MESCSAPLLQNPKCRLCICANAMQAVEELRYRELPNWNWRLAPINLKGRKRPPYAEQIARIVAVTGKGEWDLLNGLHCANVLSTEEFYARLDAAIARSALLKHCQNDARHLITAGVSVMPSEPLPSLLVS